MPTPQKPVKPGAVWLQTQTLREVKPTIDDTTRGASYAPIGLAVIGYAFGWDVGHPSGSRTFRSYEFSDEQTARAAAHEAVRAGIRTGYSMQSAQWSSGEVWAEYAGVWTDDGWNAAGDQHLVVYLRAAESWDPLGLWRVELWLEHTY